MKAEVDSVAASAISGTGWNFLGAIAASLTSLAISIFLARILGPRPYGQLIIAGTIYGFVNLFVDGGFGQALIQKASLHQREIRRTFTLQLAAGATTTSMIYLLAPWIARLFHDPTATPVIRAMSFMIVIQSLGLVSGALLRRQMNFKVIQRAGLVSLFIGNALVTVPLALRGAGVWSLVSGFLCQCAINSLLLYLAARHSLLPSFGFSARSTTAFGSTIVANNLVNWGHANLDNLAASQLGPLGLGLYGRACNFVYQPVSAAVSSLQSVLFSTAAKTIDKQRLMADLTTGLIAAVFGVLGSAYAVLALIPDTTVLGLFGDKWAGVIPLMLPLAIAMPFYAVHCLLGPIVCGLGRPTWEFWPQAISCGVAAIAFFAAARYSIAAIAWTLLAIMLLRCSLIATFAFRFLKIRFTRVIGVLAKRAAFSIAFGALAWTADQVLRVPFHLEAGPRLALLMVFCSATLGAMVWSAGDVVVGREAIAFLAAYASHLPVAYARQLRLQAGRGPAIIASARPMRLQVR